MRKKFMIACAAAVVLCTAIFLSSYFTPIDALAAEGPGAAVTFDWQDGSEPDVAAAVDGIVPVPENRPHSKDPGKVFAGWYKSAGNAGRGDAPAFAGTGFTGVVEDVTYYAHWIEADNIRYVETSDAKSGKAETLGLSLFSGLDLIYAGGAPVENPEAYAADGSNPIFKDLNKNGALDVYEDWRLTTEERAADLAAKLKADPDGVHQIAGLMLYSGHQRVWTTAIPTQAQVTFLVNDDLRHVLIASSAPAGQMNVHAEWNNSMQSIVEGLGYGIPANNSSDPRHGTGASSNVEYYSANQGVSAWPSSLGLAATFDPAITKTFGKIASIEYRAMGISTALSPQIDIATDPRWRRFSGTFGEDPKLASAMSKAYVDGFQTTYSGDGVTGGPVEGGWGMNSVNAMMKHWPGGGAGEGGRDAHYDYGKYAVYPGGRWEAHLIPFVDGSLSLEDGTGMATAVMPYYTISYMQVPGSASNFEEGDSKNLNMANAYSDYMINGVLRDAYNYEGVVCTDWSVIGPKLVPGGNFDPDIAGMIWGVDDYYPESSAMGYTDMAERAKILLSAGVDQFGGLNTVMPIMTAYNDSTAEEKPALLDQLEMSAYRLLKNVFNAGLFENPYLDVEKSVAAIGQDSFMKAGYEAQLKSTVLLKNAGDLLPLAADTKVFAPGANEAQQALLQSYFGAEAVFVDEPADADAALVFLSSMSSGGGTRDAENHVNKYAPINIGFKDYTAENARITSVAGEPVREGGNVVGMANRSYRGLTTAANEAAAVQLETLAAAEKSGLPVIAVVNVTNPFVLEDIEPSAAAILLSFESQNAAVFDIMTGSTKYGDNAAPAAAIRPTAMLPMQLPKNMNEVEIQYEDLPRDMAPYADSEGSVYDFGFGLTYGENGTAVIDKSVNPGFTAFVAENAAPMTYPLNKGDSQSAYSIERRRQVKFDYGYKESGIDKENRNLIKIVNAGDTVVMPVLVREGFTFGGWFTDAGARNAVDPEAVINGNVTYYAAWTQN